MCPSTDEKMYTYTEFFKQGTGGQTLRKISHTKKDKYIFFRSYTASVFIMCTRHESSNRTMKREESLKGGKSCGIHQTMKAEWRTKRGRKIV